MVLILIKFFNLSLEISLFGKRQLSGFFGELVVKYLKICECEYGFFRLVLCNGCVVIFFVGVNCFVLGDIGIM